MNSLASLPQAGRDIRLRHAWIMTYLGNDPTFLANPAVLIQSLAGASMTGSTKTSNIGRSLRQARLRRGITQAGLAEQIKQKVGAKSSHTASTLEQLISRIERGQHIAYPKLLLEAAIDILGPLDPEPLPDMRTRPIAIDLSREGVITYRRRGTQGLIGKFPIFFVNTEEEARRLQISLCQKMPVSHPLLPGQDLFVLVEFFDAHGGNASMDDFEEVTLKFAKAYECCA